MHLIKSLNNTVYKDPVATQSKASDRDKVSLPY